MNKRKLNRLFDLARTEPAPVPPDDFAADVLRAVHREPPGAVAEMLTFTEQLNRLFPRIAFAAATIIVVCIALDFGLTAAGIPGLSDGVSQISAQWFLAPDELSL
jgi:hypothetical protein